MRAFPKLLLAALLAFGVSLSAQSPTYHLGRTPTPEEIRAWDISISPTGKELPPLDLAGYAYQWHISRDGRLAAGQSDSAKGIMVIELATRKELGFVPPAENPGFTSVEVAPGGTALARRLIRDKKVELFDVPSMKLRHSFRIEASSLHGAGPTAPTVTITFNIQFKSILAGHTIGLEAAADDDLGNQIAFVPGGIWNVTN